MSFIDYYHSPKVLHVIAQWLWLALPVVLGSSAVSVRYCPIRNLARMAFFERRENLDLVHLKVSMVGQYANKNDNTDRY